jgi:CRISPR-associated protein (TIGR03986 family)
MLRSVIEVMSFSKMHDGNVNNDKYSVRDFQNNKKGEIYPMLDLAKQVRGAWLRKDGDKYYLQDCGAPGRIPHHWIKTDNFDGERTFRSFFKTGGGFSGNKEEHKSAKFKYAKFGESSSRENGFVEAKYGKDNSVDVRKFYKIDPLSNKRGTLVFTGQPSPRKEVPKGGTGKPSGKIHEFIFFETNNAEIEIDREIIENFFFAYFNHDTGRQSIDWKYWKPKLDRGEKIPVFFRYENEKAQTIKDMGLSYLYKIIYKKSVLDAIPDSHKQDRRDFTETLFGYIDNTQSLKGRVHIGHAKAVNTGIPLQAETSVLSGPKASYYPNYIRQTGKDGRTKKYYTFMDDTAVIAGWKRYPIHKYGVVSNPGSTENSKVETSFVPLDSGVEFDFKIRVHNVRKAELGALLSAITFHNTNGTYHSLGMAKPLGYGKTTLEIKSLDGFESDDFNIYL